MALRISCVAVVGLGTMGKQIAELFALNGYRVSIADVTEEVSERAMVAILANLAWAEQTGKISSLQHGNAKSLFTCKRIQDMCQEDLVIECVDERIETKKEIFRMLDAAAGPMAVLASNTSSFRIAEISSCISSKRVVVGMHFFNPVRVLPLVELVLPLNCPKRHSDALKDFLLKNGRKIVEVRDSPGFVVNRVLFKMIAESLLLSEEGVAPREEMDLAMKLGANLPMGPFELVDFIGLDVSKDILANLARQTGNQDFARASNILESFIRKGWLGRKSGRGFYEYTEKSGTRR